MSGELLLINPRKRGRRKNPTPPRGRGGRFVSRKRRAAPRKARRSKARAVVTVRTNPRKRRYVRRSNPVKMRRRRRSNPIGGMFGGITGQLMTALKGAGGAIVVNAAYNYIPLPAMLRAGRMQYVAKGALAILLGTFGRRFLGSMASDMARGALTVITTQAAVDLLSNTGLRLGDMGGESYSGVGYYSPGQVVEGLGEYVGESYNPGDMESQEVAEYVR